MTWPDARRYGVVSESGHYPGRRDVRASRATVEIIEHGHAGLIPVDEHPDYTWSRDANGDKAHHVYWGPQAGAVRVDAVRVGTVRPNPDRTATNQVPELLAEDADGEWIASAANVPELGRLLALHHRTARAAAQHATAAVDTIAATTDMDTADWEWCVELADYPTWWNEFGPVGRLLSGTDGSPTIDSLLRGLGVDPDREGRPDGQLRPSLEMYYERAHEQAWHSAFVRTARHRLRTP